MLCPLRILTPQGNAIKGCCFSASVPCPRLTLPISQGPLSQSRKGDPAGTRNLKNYSCISWIAVGFNQRMRS